MSLKKYEEDGGFYLRDEKLVISEAFVFHNVQVLQAFLVTNLLLGGGISSIKVGKDVLDLLEDKGLNFKPFEFN